MKRSMMFHLKCKSALVLLGALFILALPNVALAVTALHEAAENNDVAAAQTALDSGIDVNATNNKGQTPLSIVPEEKNLEVAKVIKAAGGKK